MADSGKTKGPVGTVLLVDDERHIRHAASQALELAGYEVASFERAEDLLSAFDPDQADVVITDIRMPAMDGLMLLERLKMLDEHLPVVLITGHGDIPMAVDAMRAGAYDFIEKPFASEQLVEAVGRALERRRMTREIAGLLDELAAQNAPGPKLIGDTLAMRTLRRHITAVAKTHADGLIIGETGSGKEVVARMLHELSGRRKGNFVAINCGALPETIIESELFGHEPGAFTGADKKRIGKFEHADGGTVFLDEIESMPMNMQVRLLRVLQERSVERLGSNKSIPLDVRVIAATKEDLRRAADKGTFREDLYYRLNVVTLEIPPLRFRRDDIALLFRHFMLTTCARYQLAAPELDGPTLDELTRRDWPGNVRELANAAERFVLFGDLPPAGGGKVGFEAGFEPMSLPDQVATFEKSVIAQTLARTQGDIKLTTEQLGLPRKTLYDKLKKYGLSRDDFTS